MAKKKKLKKGKGLPKLPFSRETAEEKPADVNTEVIHTGSFVADLFGEEPEPEEIPEPETVQEPEIIPEPETPQEPEIVPEPETVQEPEITEPEPEVIPEPEPEPEVIPEPEPEPEVIPEPEPEPEPEPADVADPFREKHHVKFEEAPHWIHDQVADESYVGGYRWLRSCRCSVCGQEVNMEKPVCPSCGAKMQ